MNRREFLTKHGIRTAGGGLATIVGVLGWRMKEAEKDADKMQSKVDDLLSRVATLEGYNNAFNKRVRIVLKQKEE